MFEVKTTTMIILTRRTFQSATFSCYYSSVVESSDVQLLLLDCRREQRRSITITRLSSRTATLKSCARRSSTIVTRLKDEYINWWRERENDIISLGSQNPFYQSFPVLQMMFRFLRIFKILRMFLYFKNQSIIVSSWSTSNRMIDKDFVLILWKWFYFHQFWNHFFENVLKRWARFKSTIALNTIWLIDKISCLSNDRITSSRAFISWFCNILLCSSFFASESRWIKALNDFAFTLNILAATALLSVRFFFKNFFAFFISTMMMMKMRFILTRKKDLFWFEKKLVLIRKEDW